MKFQVSNFEKNQFEVEIFHFFSFFYHSVPHLAPYSKSSNEYIWFLVFLKTSSHYYLSFKTNINLLRCILRSQWANIAKLMFFWIMAADNRNRIGWRYRKFHRTCLIENLITHVLCSIHLFDQIHRLWDNEVFRFFEWLFWKCNTIIMVEDTLNLMTHSI